MEVAEQIVHVLEEMHVSSHTVHPFLESVGQLGYQIYLANRSGEAYFSVSLLSIADCLTTPWTRC